MSSNAEDKECLKRLLDPIDGVRFEITPKLIIVTAPYPEQNPSRDWNEVTEPELHCKPCKKQRVLPQVEPFVMCA